MARSELVENKKKVNPKNQPGWWAGLVMNS